MSKHAENGCVKCVPTLVIAELRKLTEIRMLSTEPLSPVLEQWDHT